MTDQEIARSSSEIGLEQYAKVVADSGVEVKANLTWVLDGNTADFDTAPRVWCAAMTVARTEPMAAVASVDGEVGVSRQRDSRTPAIETSRTTG